MMQVHTAVLLQERRGQGQQTVELKDEEEVKVGLQKTRSLARRMTQLCTVLLHGLPLDGFTSKCQVEQRLKVKDPEHFICRHSQGKNTTE